MGGIGGEVADVLQINDHAEAREHGGDDHRDHAGTLDIDARVARDLHILTDRAHILTELGAAEPEDKEAGGGNDNEREHGDLHAADADRQQVIQALAHIQQAHRIPDTVAARELERIVDDGNDGTHHKEHKELVHTVHGEGDHVARDHLAALGTVEELADHDAEQNGDGNGDDRREDQSGDAPDLPVGSKDQSDLACHRAERHAEVHTHARHNGDEQAQDEESVAAQTGHALIEQIVPREVRARDAVGADQNEHDGHDVVAQEPAQRAAPFGAAARKIVVDLFHTYFFPPILRVSA